MEQIGNFTVLKVAHRTYGKTKRRTALFYYCRCVCGSERWYDKYAITNRRIKSCGCITKSRKHNGRNTRLYNIWHGIKRRCDNSNFKGYKYYGGKGVTYHSSWKDFEPFRDWAISAGYNDTLTIDRIDVNGNYEPDNCRWVTMKVQQNNKTTNTFIEYNGVTHTITEWSEIYNEPRLGSRLKLGWSFEEAAGLKPHQRKESIRTSESKNRTYFSALTSEALTIEQWADRLKIPKNKLLRYMSMCNYNIDAIISKPADMSWIALSRECYAREELR